MTSKHRLPRNHERDRERIAQTAARLMQESGSRDVGHARAKAARLLGLDDPASLPDEGRIARALEQQLRLFAPASRIDALQEKRDAAIQAMDFFQPFSPRLVGPVLTGTADAASPVQLHLHSDSPEAVQLFLHDQHIRATLHTARLRLQRDTLATLPCWRLDADGVPFELLVLPESALRQAPLQPLDDMPMPRASRTQLQRQILSTAGAG